MISARKTLFVLSFTSLIGAAQADENLFGYIRGAETLPKGSFELYETLTQRSDKGTGSYRALDSETELEYGVTDKFTAAIELNGQAIRSEGILIDGYMPKDIDSGMRLSGIGARFKYNFLSPAIAPVGLSATAALEHAWLDHHSGQDKKSYSAEFGLQAQKYFLDGELIWVGNLGLEATHAKRAAINNLPAGFDWPTDPEMEVELKAGTGLSYRFAPGWFAGVEALWEQEHETEVGLERWSLFAGPSLHYGGKDWWATFTWLPQIRGGGEQFTEQGDFNLHLIEKTKQEVRLKVGFNF